MEKKKNRKEKIESKRKIEEKEEMIVDMVE